MSASKQSFGKNILTSLLYVLFYIFIYFLFILPFDFWRKAVNRLVQQKEKALLSAYRLRAPWPFFAFFKIYFVDFFLDALALLCYLFGPFIALGFGLYMKEPMLILSLLVAFYYAPLSLALFRDLLIVMLLPLRKTMSWLTKPAQYMDLEIRNK